MCGCHRICRTYLGDDILQVGGLIIARVQLPRFALGAASSLLRPLAAVQQVEVQLGLGEGDAHQQHSGAGRDQAGRRVEQLEIATEALVHMPVEQMPQLPGLQIEHIEDVQHQHRDGAVQQELMFARSRRAYAGHHTSADSGQNHLTMRRRSG